MIKSINDLLVTYCDYSDPLGKIHREIKKKNLFSVVKGLYETDISIPGYYLSAFILSPSYLSFEYALYHHGLIPEKVEVYTSATFEKRKSKKYENTFGKYTYRDIPKTAYPYGIIAYVVDGYSYFIASKEKAICDRLYIAPPQTSIKGLKILIFDDLRIDEENFYSLDMDELLFLCAKYKSSNMKILSKVIMKELK